MPEKTFLTAILVDDELKALENLKHLIGVYCPHIRVVNIAAGADSAAIIINEQKPDVLFLDIAMPKKNGFDLLNMLSFIPLVVFVTAYEKYALNAIKASAIDYLLKPIDINELKRVEEKLLKVHSLGFAKEGDSYSKVIGNFVNILNNSGTIQNITLPGNDGYNVVPIEDVLFLEGDNNYSTFHIHRKPKIVVSQTLKNYEELLLTSGFFRIHKSSIINLIHLKKIINGDEVFAVMADDSVLPVSRRRVAEFMKVAKQYFP
jgi:two-component system LytT family response regulator